MARYTILLFVTFACSETSAPSHARVTQQTSVAPLPSVTAEQCADGGYQAEPAWSGRAASLPPPPTLPTTPIRMGDAYTVYGAVHTLHSVGHAGDLASPITIVGVIVDTNLARANKCALHHTGRADPPTCPPSETPAFTIADDVTSPTRIRVLGWASNFANAYEAYLSYRSHPSTPYVDELWATTVPNPLPAVGAIVKVTGHYGATFGRSSMGVVSDQRSGILTYDSITYVQPPQATRVPFPQLPKP